MTWEEKPSFRQERRRGVRELRQRGTTTRQIGRTFARDYNESLLKAFRWAHDWTLAEACERFNNDVADDPEHGAMSPSRLSLYENWPRSANPECRPPSIPLLHEFAKLYQCAPGDLIEGTDYTADAETPAEAAAADALPLQDAADDEQATVASPTLLRVLVTQAHWRPFEAFRTQYERAARELAERDQDPRLGRLSVGKRQFDRWLAGGLKTMPYPDHCRVLEYLFGYPVDALFSPAPQASEPSDANALAASEDGTFEAEAGPLSDSALAEAVLAARKQAGRELARLRGRAGLSQQDLAHRVGYTRGQVAGAEAGSQSTAPEFWQACDRVLAAGGALLVARGQVGAAMRVRRDAAVRREEARREARLQRWRVEQELPFAETPDRESWLGLADADVSIGSLDLESISGTTGWTAQDASERRGNPSHRRHVVKLGGTFTLASLLQLLSVEPDRMNEALDAGTVSDDRIARFESVADELGLRAVKVAPTTLLGDAVVNFRSVRRLAQQKQRTSRQVRLQRIGAKFGIVVGEILFIEGHFDLARHWYQTAQHAASEGGDRFLADIALASEAYLPTYSDDPRGVLSLVTPRLEQRAYPTPAIAWLWAFKAKAHAQLGERAKFQEAITQAHTAMTKSKPEQVSPGIYSFLPEKLAFYEATGYVKLRDVGNAVAATDRALELYDLTHTTEPALVRFNKASALAASGEIPEACRVATGALLDEYTYPSVSVLTAARDFDRLLGSDAGTPARDWREALVAVRREPARMALPTPDA